MYINDFKHDKALTITHCSLMTLMGQYLVKMKNTLQLNAAEVL